MSKLQRPMRNLIVGDIVIILEDSHFTNHWPLAKVSSVFPGKDEKVRVFRVRTATSTYKRPITKLALMIMAKTFVLWRAAYWSRSPLINS